MRFSKAILLTLLVSALSVYAIDCPPAMTPMQMMQCCKTMPCSHGKDCCKVKPASHAPFINAVAARLHSPPATGAVVIPATQARAVVQIAAAFATTRCHAPPGPQLGATPIPLRI